MASLSQTAFFEPNGRHCRFVQKMGIRPYRRCRYCDLRFRECFPTQFLAAVLGILALLVVLFTVQDLPIIAFQIAALIVGMILVLAIISRRELNEFVLSNVTLQNISLQLENRIRSRTQELQEANAMLEKASQLKTDFLSMVSHELRTPLTAIVGYADLLGAPVIPEESKKNRFLDAIKRNSKMLLQMVNNLLNAERLELGMVNLTWGRVDLVSVCRETIDLFFNLAAVKPVAITFGDPPAAAIVETDEEKLRHILINLIGNALKFTPAHGMIHVVLAEDGMFFKISVRDSGIGIAPKDFDKIFEKFVQVESPVTPSVHGTGLGLAVAKGFAELLGGKIWVESDGKAKGSTFSFTIPKRR